MFSFELEGYAVLVVHVIYDLSGYKFKWTLRLLARSRKRSGSVCTLIFWLENWLELFL